MKKFLMMACMMLFSTAMFAQQGAMYLGGNLNYATDYENFGIGAKAQYEFIQNLRAEASADYFFKKNDVSMWDINANMHYLFRISDKFAVYPLAGLNLAFFNHDIPTRLGVNLGGGLEYYVASNVKIGGEAKYIVSDNGYSRFGANFGVTFLF